MKDALGFPQKVYAIVQARMGAERLPGKMMMDLAGKPVIAHVIDRLKMCKTLTGIVVATPDEELARYAYSRGVMGYHDPGDPNNVLLRYIKVAGWCNAQIVVRITGDEPLIDPSIVDEIVLEYVKSRVDIATNVFRRSFPKGMDVEVLHYNTLKRIYHLTGDPLYLEHVTLFCYENPALFRIKNVSHNGRDCSFMNCSIDDQEDLDTANLVMPMLMSGYGYLDVVRSYKEVWQGRASTRSS